VIDKYLETGGVKDRPGRGRKRILTKADERKMVKKAKKDLPATRIAAEYRKTKKKLLRSALHRHHLKWLRIHKVEKLSEANTAKRLKYAKEMKNHNWRQTMFSDEKTFWVGSGPTHAWQEIGNRREQEYSRYGPKVVVWGTVGYYFKIELYFTDDIIDGDVYRAIIKRCLNERKIIYAPDCPPELRENWEFLQDNYKTHKAKATMKLLQKLVPNRLCEVPAQSPDFNVIEDMWSYLDRLQKEKVIRSISQLKKKLKKW